MEDDVAQGWAIDQQTRLAMRMASIHAAIAGGDHDLAIIEAEELLDEEPDHAGALFLLAECLLELGDAAGAVPVYEHKLTLEAADGPTLTGLAIARFDSCDLPGCIEAAREAIRIESDRAEAHFYLALALERSPGRRAESLACMMAARQLDAQSYPFPIELTSAEWEAALNDAILSVPGVVSEFWADVPFVFFDLPELDELRAGQPPITPTVSGLYEGEPPEDEDPGRHRPTRMRLFTANLARTGSYEAVVAQIAMTLVAEASSWLGLDDDE